MKFTTRAAHVDNAGTAHATGASNSDIGFPVCFRISA